MIGLLSDIRNAIGDMMDVMALHNAFLHLISNLFLFSVLLRMATKKQPPPVVLK